MTVFSSRIAEQLPYLRRYARALTGAQNAGDTVAAATLVAVLQDPQLIDRSVSIRLALYTCFHRIWTRSGSVRASPLAETGLRLMAQRHMDTLTPNSREALLLNTIEGFSSEEVAQIIGITAAEVQVLLDTAYEEMVQSAAGKVLIIEDEPLIAMDIRGIIEELGHQVIGTARTHAQAVFLGKEQRPDLILADIQLADQSSGIAAVQELLGAVGQLPVIFITAYPEKLLTGEGPEPAFLISKPYLKDHVQSAVSQAMFFASTESLLT